MSEEEVEYEDEEGAEDKKEDAKNVKNIPPPSPGAFKYNSSPTLRNHSGSLTQAEQAMIVVYPVVTVFGRGRGGAVTLLRSPTEWAAKKRQEDDEAAKLKEYEYRRRNEREREEKELRILKEKQEQRRLQREEEEREQYRRRQQEEERRILEEEERKARLEEERRKREEAVRKRQKLMNTSFVSTPTGNGGRNFILPKRKEKGGDKFGNIVQAKQEMGMTNEQQDTAKRNFLTNLVKTLDTSSLSGPDLRARLKEMHHRLCKLETEKYDLEKRHERQEYDLIELNERQRQLARNRAARKGLDPANFTNSRYPPKVSVSSKYDRQTDRRNFSERRNVFDNKNSHPCFPNVPPPPTVLQFKLDQSKEPGNQAGSTC